MVLCSTSTKKLEWYLPVMSVTFSETIAPGLKQSFKVFATRGKMSSKFLESLEKQIHILKKFGRYFVSIIVLN